MKKLLAFFLIVSATGSMALAQKTINDLNAEKRTVTSFHGIEVATGIELTLTEGGTEEVAVSAATIEYRDKIVTKVENGILKIYYDNKVGAVNKRKESHDLKAYVSFKSLDKIEATTGAHVDIDGTLKSSSLDLKANTGALVKGQVDITDLKVSQNTGSKITLSGKAGKLEIDGDTGSKFLGEELATTNCNAKVSTGAQITVIAESGLEAKANTGGWVKYKGNASIREIKTSTGGSVKRI